MPDRIRYYVEKNGNAFWAPGKQADAFSFPRSQPLGPAGPAAMAAAIGWNAKTTQAGLIGPTSVSERQRASSGA